MVIDTHHVIHHHRGKSPKRTNKIISNILKIFFNKEGTLLIPYKMLEAM